MNAYFLFDETNKIIGSNRLANIDNTLSDIIEQQDNTDHRQLKETFALIRKTMNGKVYLTNDAQKIIGAYPIVLSLKETELSPTDLGVLLLTYDISYKKTTSTKKIFELGKAYTLFLFSFAFFIWLFFQFTFAKRVKILISAAEKHTMQEKNILTELSGRDELATLSKTFDHMIIENQKHKETITNLNKKLEEMIKERTNQLEPAKSLEANKN